MLMAVYWHISANNRNKFIHKPMKKDTVFSVFFHLIFYLFQTFLKRNTSNGMFQMG